MRSNQRRRDNKTGRFVVSNANTPFAAGGPGIPGGWTPIADNPGTPKKPDLPRIIRSDPPKPEKNAYLNNLKATRKFMKDLSKAQGLPFEANQDPKVESFLEQAKKKARKTPKEGEGNANARD